DAVAVDRVPVDVALPLRDVDAAQGLAAGAAGAPARVGPGGAADAQDGGRGREHREPAHRIKNDRGARRVQSPEEPGSQAVIAAISRVRRCCGSLGMVVCNLTTLARSPSTLIWPSRK